ncbi:MAG: hypothetical protein K6U02_00155 [Firmicutes bacterium]|nr:hypothetical protein [Bacillota bacterium]
MTTAGVGPAAGPFFFGARSERLLAIVNPAAGGGRCGRQAARATAQLLAAGVPLDVAYTTAPGHATQLAREEFAQGRRRFLAVGGDGTAFEILNGVFPEAGSSRVTLGLLPLGTGNSFLRDFLPERCEATRHALAAIASGRTRPCDVIRAVHASGALYYINLLSMGFAADVAALVNRRFKPFGRPGYLLGVLVGVLMLRRRAFPVRVDGAVEFDRRRCLFLAFSNSRFTGGNMLMAPLADAADGKLEYVRWGPIGRLRLLWNLPRLFTGTHIYHRLAERCQAQWAEFHLDEPVEVMVDGESLRLRLERLDVLPSALDVLV